MKKFVSKKAIGRMSIILLVIVCMIPIFAVLNQTGKLSDKEFQGGSKVQFTEITEIQSENLYRLAKVWGFVKYRHPSITGGQLNWDYEVFRIMPLVLNADTTHAANEAIFKWLSAFHFEIPVLQPDIMEIKNFFDTNKLSEADLSWINDTTTLGSDLSGYLTKLSEVMVIENPKGYAAFYGNTFSVHMDSEDSYPSMKYNDTGLRLLGLFRYWNIIEYFYPYKDIIAEDWNQVLKDMIPQFIGGQDEESYVLAVCKLSTYIHDTHASVKEPHGVLFSYFGRKTPPVNYINIDGKIVISAISGNKSMGAESLHLGDIVLSVDGVSIEDRISNCKEYISLSNENRFVAAFGFYLLGTDNDTAVIEVLRNGKPLLLNVSCSVEKPNISRQSPSGFLENEQIGYINPGKLQKGELDKLMEKFSNTKGLVIDLRNYPSDNIIFTLAEYLVPTPTPFTKIGYCNQLVPGSFFLAAPSSSGRGTVNKSDDKPLYQNKTVLLMNEETISNPEFTIMSVRNGPNVVVLGSPSGGADGNVVEFTLPGRIETRITGLSILYPDGRQTQRVGLEPDIYCYPTVAGIRDGSDELLDKAVSLILHE